MAVTVVLAAPLSATSLAGATPVAESQSISVTENVDVWERSFLPLRTTSEGPTTVTAPRTFINIESAATGDLPLNKRVLTVHERNESINMTFESTIGAGTTGVAGEEAQLLAVRLTETPNIDVNNSSVQTSLEGIFANGSNITSAELLDDTEGVSSIDENGTLEAAFTPDSGGAYGFVLVTVDDGEGLTVKDENVSVDGNVTVVGIEQALVQENASTVESTQNQLNPGDNVTFGVDAGTENESVMHAVILFRQGELQQQSSTVTVSGDLNENFSAEQASVENSFDSVSGVASVGNDTALAGENITGVQTASAIGLPGLFGVTLSEASAQPSEPGDEVVHASATIVSDDPDTNVTVETLDSWPNGAYKFVHIAVGEVSGQLYTDTGTIALSQAGGPGSAGGPDDTDEEDDENAEE